MLLTDEQKSQAKTLGLTYTEMTVALRTRIPPETYAHRKQELLVERDAWEAKLSGMSDAMLERAVHFRPTNSGECPDSGESAPEGGGQSRAGRTQAASSTTSNRVLRRLHNTTARA